MIVTCSVNKGILNHVSIEIEDFCTDVDNKILTVFIPHIVEEEKIHTINGFKSRKHTFADFIYKGKQINNIEDYLTEINFIIDEGITKIYHMCFLEKALINFKFPSSLEILEGINCSNLNRIEFDNDSHLRKIGEKCFYLSCFYSLLTIPKSVRKIERHAFSYATFYKGFKFEEDSELDTIERDAFSYAESSVAINLNIPRKVKLIEDFAFYNFKGLNSLKIDSKVNLKTIGKECFSGSDVKEVMMASSDLVELGNGCFDGCKSLNTIDMFYLFAREIPDDFCCNSSISKILLPQSLETIGCSAFRSCKLLKKIQFPSVLKNIEERAFANSELNSFSFVKNICNLIDIEDYAFENCKLTTLPSEILTDLNCCGEGAFKNNAFKTLTLLAPKVGAKFYGGIFSQNKELETLQLRNTSLNQWCYIFPSMFFDCNKLSDIDIPYSILMIGEKCFAWTNLKEFNANSMLSRIHKDAFLGCHELEKVDLSSCNIEFIENGVFKFTNLKILKFPILYNFIINKDCFNDELSIDEINKIIDNSFIYVQK